MNQTIEITPTDPIFFRDGRPFVMGEENFSNGIFPPYPSVFLGALRTAYFAENMAAFLTIDTNDPTKALKINNFGLKIAESCLFPFPSDLVMKKGGTGVVRLKLTETKDQFVSSHRSKYFLTANLPDKLEETNGKYFLTENGFKKYLDNQAISTTDFIKISDYMTAAPKIGIARKNGVSYDGHFYRFNRIHPESSNGDRLSFLLAFEGLPLSQNTRLAVGSDGTSAGTKTAVFPTFACPDIKLNQIFKLILTTPAIFNEGWKPTFLNQTGIEILTFATAKSVSIGGFDIKVKKAKPMNKAVPSGCVFYLKVTDTEILDNLKLLHGKSISDKMPNEGFGIMYLAKHTL